MPRISNASQIPAAFQLAVNLHQNGHLNDAADVLQGILALSPQHFDANHLLGIIAFQGNHFRQAAQFIGRALTTNPNDPTAHYNRGVALENAGLHHQALESYEAAIKLKPNYVDAHYNRGVSLQALKRFTAALNSYDATIMLRPDHAAAHNNRGNMLRALGQREPAIASYSRAIQLAPGYAATYSNRGAALSELRRYEEALADYESALRLGSDQDFLYGVYIHTRMRLCMWTKIGDAIADLTQRIERNESCTPAFPTLALTEDAVVHRKAARIWTERKYPPAAGRPNFPKRHSKKIRIGYFSGDFRDHATAYLIAGLIETHDRERLEVYAFSYGVNTQDAMRQRLEKAFDSFIDVGNLSDEEAVALARAREIDIAIDLGGHAGEARTGIVAARVAPVQASFLGYPGTMAAEYMDYIIADHILIPPEGREHFSEQVVYLPHSYQPNDSRRAISTRIFTRENLGLPNDAFVFCSFNSSYKITPKFFDVWMRILEQTPRSVLWLYQDNTTSAQNLREEAKIRGIDPARLIFGEHLPHDEHLARLRAADLVLDTLPCSAHTTASDALWAGVPVLTCLGKSFAGRVAASLLSAAGLPEMIAATTQEYERRAIDFALDPASLTEISRKLARNRLSSPLFDTALFARHIEKAYIEMRNRHLAGLPPSDLSIKP